MKIDISKASVDIAPLQAEVKSALEKLDNGTGKGADFIGWHHLPSETTDAFLAEVQQAASVLRSQADFVVVVGIGGSYLGARAVIEALSNSFDHLQANRQNPVVLYAGQNIGEDYLAELLDLLRGRRFGIVNISKSGTTTEPAIAFRLLKELLESQVGKDKAKGLIIAITDKERGALRTLANKEGYKTFVIADNVGDNVGDVAGMGADLYESYAGSILATMALGASAFATSAVEGMQYKAVFAPMLIAAVGVLLSIIGIFLVRTKENAGMKELLGALSRGTNTAAVLIAVATFGIMYFLFGKETGEYANMWWQTSLSVVVGLLAGVIIGKATEYYTSQSYKPTQKVAESSKTGPATVIISGLGLGMLSTAIPVVTVGVAIILAYLCANGFHIAFTAENLSRGLYGIGIAAVGMLSTLGITLATDAYGPIADNAGGNAEMSGLDPEVRQRTDALDALGNTTAATGKGFAIGSAALTALALLASYVEEIKLALIRVGETTITVGEKVINTTSASLVDFMNYYNVNLMNPIVLVGIFIGAMMAFVFCGMTMNAVGRAAQKMVEEVRRQFSTIKGILEGKAEPDYERCVAISTKGAQHEMLLPSILAILVPILTGVILGVPGVLGLLIGGLSTGFVLAVFMANSGGAWDNAKKYVEEGNFGGKGSENHKATVVGDTVGDPFKDTSGPSLNILIKLMSMVSIVMAGLTVSFHLL